MSPTVRTTYRVEDDRGVVETVFEPEQAEALSRAGYRVTALSEAWTDE